MKIHTSCSAMLAPFLLLATAPLGVLAGDVLQTNGFASCLNGNSSISVDKLNISFDRSTKMVMFDVGGTNAMEQNVMAILIVNAYGREVYRNSFDPCTSTPKVAQLCPVPKGTFSAKGEQSIPDKYISQIPAIAFQIPDIDSQATMQLKSKDTNQDVACITSDVSNGQSLSTVGATYIAAGMAAGALAVSGLASLASAGQAGAPASSPTFGDVIGWFQSMAFNGMMTAKVPGVYRSWSKNFGFSTGLIYWGDMQTSIESFRSKTGGNLTDSTAAFLRNATLVHVDQNVQLSKRDMENFMLWARDSVTVGVSGSTTANGDTNNKVVHAVKGIQGFVEQYTIPNESAFMTVLLIFAIVIAAVTVAILLFKVILETWALCGTFPKRLTGFRKRYWWTLAKTLTSLILLLYGIWVLYCVYQFKRGDSWGAKALAGVTLVIFTAILAFFTWKISSIANKYKTAEGDAHALYDDKEVWRKYSIFYENYKKNYWWVFMPLIVYMFARGCVIAGADGHGLAQAAGQLIVEALFLIVLLWARPYSLKSSNWINIIIQVVRVVSVACILIFVEELGLGQTTKTVTGLVLVVVQASLTGILAILIAVNAIIVCCKTNPHRKKRKEAEKNRDNLTPLDARNSLLMDPAEYQRTTVPSPFGSKPAGYNPIPMYEQNTAYHGHSASVSGDQNHLLAHAPPFGRQPSHDSSMEVNTPARSLEVERTGTDFVSNAPWQPQRPVAGGPRVGVEGA